MQIINLTVKNQVIVPDCTDHVLVAGSQDQVYVQFALDAEWSGLTVIALFANDFYNNGQPIERIWIGDPVEVPPETLVTGRLRIGLNGLGEGGTPLLPTAYMEKGIRIYRNGGLIAMQPEQTPDVWQQILAAAQAAAVQAKADADRAAQLAEEMRKAAEQVSLDAAAASKAKADAEAALTAAQAALAAAETAKTAAVAAANAAAGNATAAQSAAAAAQNAANAAATALADISNLYQQMQAYAGAALRDIQAAGDYQVNRVATEGAAQIAAAKVQADRAEVAAGEARTSATAADQARVNAEAARDASAQSASAAAGSATASKESADKAATAAIRQPYPNAETGTWWVWDAEAGEYMDSGAPIADQPSVVEVPGAELSLTLTNNTEYRCTDPVTSLEITGFAAGTEGKAEQWSIVFTAGDTITVTVPDAVVWAVAEPVFTPGSTYWMSIVPLGAQYLAVWTEVETDESASA